ncbi:MAG: cyclic nucleotide-binding domain-containing protein [Gammaproteobacteria bacterium]|nr:cyclic nucleotide-binding domain-containing protein [Gammaproteobacteria bacterium]
MDLLQEAELLRKVPMFSRLEPAKLKLLAFTSENLSFEDGEVLFLVGDPADSAYVIMEGEVEVMAETDAGEVVAVTLKQNQLFGEMAVLSNAPRSATIRAKGQLRALRITDEAFIKLLSDNPDVALDVLRQLSDKLAASHRQFEDLQRKWLRMEQPASG